MVANFSTGPQRGLFASGNTLAIGDFYGGTIRTVNANGGYRLATTSRSPEATSATGFACRKGTSTPIWRVGASSWAISSKSYFQSFVQYNSRTNQVGLNLRLGLLSTSSTGLYIGLQFAMSRRLTIQTLTSRSTGARPVARFS